MSATVTTARTITGRHPITGESFPVELAAGETVVGVSRDGLPLVRRADGAFGGTFGVAYLVDAGPYDPTEAFDPGRDGAA